MNSFKISKNHSFWLNIGKRRWLKKILSPYMPSIGAFNLNKDFSIFLSLKDIRGPSFYLMFGGKKAFDHYEQEDKKEILNYLPKDGVFLDAGANIGLFSFYIHRHLPQVQIIAIEPHPLLNKCIELTKNKNSIQNLRSYLNGLSDKIGEMNLFIDDTDSGGHSLDHNSLSENKNTLKKIQVQVTTLDEIVKKENFQRVDFIKIDVQDLEPQVLLGTQETIKKFKPCFLIEFNNKYLSDEAFFNVFKFPLNDNYQWKSIESSPQNFSHMKDLKNYAKQQLEQHKQHTNYLFVPNHSQTQHTIK